jgi:protease-4
MTMPPDYAVDRWRLVRRAVFWRRIAFGLVILAVLVAGWRFSASSAFAHLTPHVARIKIEGVIVGDESTLKLIRDVAKSRASGVILSIESPGGTTTGAEKLYDELRRLAEKKPLVATVGTMAASGGYIAALGADKIVARGNSLVGSIGVLFEIPNVAQLLDKLGVKVETVKSSPLKAAPNGFEPTSEAAREALAALVADSFTWFKGLVQNRRHMSDAELAAVSDGRVFTGRQGIGLKLVDAIGGEREAVAWLESRGVAKDLPIRDWKAPRSIEGLGILGSASGFAESLGLAGIAAFLAHFDNAARGFILDGLVSIWQG